MDPEIEELKKGITEGMKQTDAFLRILDITDRCCQDEAIRNMILRYDELETRLVALESLMQMSETKMSNIEGVNLQQTQMMDRLLDNSQGLFNDIEQRLINAENARMILEDQGDSFAEQMNELQLQSEQRQTQADRRERRAQRAYKRLTDVESQSSVSIDSIPEAQAYPVESSSTASTEILTWRHPVSLEYTVGDIVVYGKNGNEYIVRIESTMLGTTDLMVETVRARRVRIRLEDIIRPATQSEIEYFTSYTR